MGSQTAGGAESHRGCLPIRRRPGGCKTASGEGGDGGEGGGGDSGRWRRGFGRWRRWIPSGWCSGERTCAAVK